MVVNCRLNVVSHLHGCQLLSHTVSLSCRPQCCVSPAVKSGRGRRRRRGRGRGRGRGHGRGRGRGLGHAL